MPTGQRVQGDREDQRRDLSSSPNRAVILAFAERILPRASELWVQASLDYKQRLQQLFFPEGIAFDGNRFNRTAATAPLFNYLAPSESDDGSNPVRFSYVRRHEHGRDSRCDHSREVSEAPVHPRRGTRSAKSAGRIREGAPGG